MRISPTQFDRSQDSESQSRQDKRKVQVHGGEKWFQGKCHGGKQTREGEKRPIWWSQVWVSDVYPMLKYVAVKVSVVLSENDLKPEKWSPCYHNLALNKTLLKQNKAIRFRVNKLHLPIKIKKKYNLLILRLSIWKPASCGVNHQMCWLHL